MKRKIIIVVATLAIISIGVFISNLMAESKKMPPKKKVKNVATVFTEQVKNGDVSVEINATGKLIAKNRIEIFAEVQGVMQATKKAFKEGTSFRKGESLLSVDAAVFEAGLKAQKSNLQNLITGALADIRLDFPQSFPQWEAYAQKLDVNQPLPELPRPVNDQEKMFISGRNIYVTYYNVKNAELTLDKYSIYAPFSGVLTEAKVTPGSLVRPGQKLGAFISPTVYEMEAPIMSSMVKYLKVGQEVQLTSTLDQSQHWNGKVVRINSAINSSTQTVNAFIEVSGENLDEGMFLESVIQATKVSNAMEIPRSVLFNENQVFVAKDSVLVQREITPVYFKEKTVIVRGLKNGEQVLVKTVPSAYPGMKVSIYSEK